MLTLVSATSYSQLMYGIFTAYLQLDYSAMKHLRTLMVLLMIKNPNILHHKP